jgi:hypothetical protein
VSQRQPSCEQGFGAIGLPHGPRRAPRQARRDG